MILYKGYKHKYDIHFYNFYLIIHCRFGDFDLIINFNIELYHIFTPCLVATSVGFTPWLTLGHKKSRYRK